MGLPGISGTAIDAGTGVATDVKIAVKRLSGQATTWLEPVSDADYLKAPAKVE